METEQNCNILTPTLMAVGVVSFSFSRAAQPEAWGLSFLLNAGFLYHILSPKLLGGPSAGSGFPYHILSATSLVPNSLGAPRVPSAGLSLPHLISNFSGPQLIWGPKSPFGLVWFSLPHLVSNSNCLTSCLD